MKKRLLMTTILISLLNSFLFSGCTSKPENQITKSAWGNLEDGRQVDLYTLNSSTGIEVKITNYGGIITSIVTPDKNGDKANIVNGFNNLEGYHKGVPYFGAIIGRSGNRMAKGQFSINDSTYQVTINDGINHLHGGKIGYDKVLWIAEAKNHPDKAELILNYHSFDGEEGYPGNLFVTVTYQLSGNELKIIYEAVTDKPTPVNLTNHSYFNLSGKGTILDHLLTINAANYTPVDNTLIPTGEILSVENTPFDFTSPTAIGDRISQVRGGYDHNWVLNQSEEDLPTACILEDPKSGRILEIKTTEPGVQFYSGNFLNGSLKSENRAFERYSALCLETQHFPDSPNHENFPSTILLPNQKYYSTTVHVFKTTNQK